MSLSGVDTSQMMARFTTTESQQEWADVKEALLKAFPGQSMEELQAAATAVLASNPNLGVDDLVMILADKFDVSVSSEKAAAIRTEWEEFNQVSELSPSELMEVLDDYADSKVNTKGQKYLLLLVNLLRQELSELTSKTDEADLEAEKSKFEADLEALANDLDGVDDRTTKEKVMQWIGAAYAVAAAAATVALAVTLTCMSGGIALGIAGPAALSMCLFAASSVATAATGEDYSLASVASEVLQWIGIPEDVADVLGVVFEVLHVVQASLIAGPTVLMAEAQRILAAGDGIIGSLFEQAVGSGDENNVENTEFSEAELEAYDMTESEIDSLKETIKKLLELLKGKQARDAAMLEAIFNALKQEMSAKGSALISMVMQNNATNMA